MNLQKEKKLNWCKVLFFSTLILFLVTLSAQIFLTNKLALKSKELKQLADRKQELQKSISKLEYEDSQLSSLSAIEQRAHLLGFVEMKDPIGTIQHATVAANISH